VDDIEAVRRRLAVKVPAPAALAEVRDEVTDAVGSLGGGSIGRGKWEKASSSSPSVSDGVTTALRLVVDMTVGVREVAGFAAAVSVGADAVVGAGGDAFDVGAVDVASPAAALARFAGADFAIDGREGLKARAFTFFFVGFALIIAAMERLQVVARGFDRGPLELCAALLLVCCQFSSTLI
jgi:hypothetical protein